MCPLSCAWRHSTGIYLRMFDLSSLLDDAKCFELVRHHRWPDGVHCPHCGGSAVVRNGRDEHQQARQRYLCKDCRERFDDLSGTALAGHHQPLRVWVLCLYFMGLNLSNQQIARELNLGVSDVQAMTEHLRAGLAARAEPVTLTGDVEIDEVYVVAGHKGNPEAVTKKVVRDDGAACAAQEGAVPWKRRSRRSLASSSAAAKL